MDLALLHLEFVTGRTLGKAPDLTVLTTKHKTDLFDFQQ